RTSSSSAAPTQLGSEVLAAEVSPSGPPSDASQFCHAPHPDDVCTRKRPTAVPSARRNPMRLNGVTPVAVSVRSRAPLGAIGTVCDVVPDGAVVVVEASATWDDPVATAVNRSAKQEPTKTTRRTRGTIDTPTSISPPVQPDTQCTAPVHPCSTVPCV